MTKVSRLSLVMGAVGLSVLIVTAVIFSGHFAELMRSYLFAYLFWSDLALGAFGLVMIYHLTGGVWGAISRRTLEALAGTMGVVAALSVPVLVAVAKIYPWMQPEIAAEPKVLHKQIYLNPASFAVRTGLYFAAWLVINHYLQHWSEAENKARSESAERDKLRNLSAGGLVFFGFSITFAAIDWQMSIEPTWYSTVYGMVFAIGEALTAYSFALAVIGLLARKMKLDLQFTPKAQRDLGNILLILTMLWAYLSFMQYLIIWSGNLPHEVTWLNHRMNDGWQWVALFLISCQFAAPFGVLLFRSNKHNLKRLTFLSAAIFCVRVVDHYWMLTPGFGYKPLDMPVSSMLTWVGVGAIWFAAFVNRLNLKPVFAIEDRDWSEGRHD